MIEIIKKIFANKNFVKLSLGASISYFGSNFTLVAVLAINYAFSRTNFSLGFTAFLFIVPYLFASPISGILSDSIPKKKILIATDLIRIALVGFYLVAYGLKSSVMMYVVTFWVSFFSVLFNNAKESLTPLLVAHEEIPQFNSFLHLLKNVFFVLSMLISGYFISLFGYKAVFIFDALTYALSIFLILSIQYKDIPRPETERTAWATYIAGVQYIRRKGELIGTVACHSIKNFGYGFLNVLYPIFVFSIFSKTSKELGYLYALLGVAQILSNSLCLRFLKSIIETHYVAILACALLIEITGVVGIHYLTSSFIVFLIPLAWLSFGDGISEVAVTTKLMHACDKEYLGRVNSFFSLLANTCYAAGMLICGVISDKISVSWILALVVASFLLSAMTFGMIRNAKKLAV